MTTQNIAYSSNTAVTISPASLASSSSFIAGCESNEVDNTTNKYDDVMVRGKVTVGTTPTANTQINIYAWGANTSLGTKAIDVLDGTDSAETLTNTGVLGAALVLAATINVFATTSDVGYNFHPFCIADLFGCVPKFWGLFVAHNTGVNLNATGGNHEIEYVGITHTNA